MDEKEQAKLKKEMMNELLGTLARSALQGAPKEVQLDVLKTMIMSSIKTDMKHFNDITELNSENIKIGLIIDYQGTQLIRTVNCKNDEDGKEFIKAAGATLIREDV